MSRAVTVSKKFHVKKDDEVEVISGSHRGKKGRILQILTGKNRVIIEGVALMKKASRPTQSNPKGGIEEKEGTIHISNVRATKPAASKKASKK